jgi:amino acid adenylation domain-containing protein
LTGYPHDVAAVFREVVARQPEHKALAWSPDEAVTFAELDRLSDRVAWFLQEQGVSRGDRVCLRLDKCTLAYAVIVGCLKVGAPYFVVDVANPPTRANHIITKCAPKVVFTAAESPLDVAAGAVFAIDKEDQFGFLDAIPDEPFAAASEITGADPAYIMFTSGSTGFPKGAVMSHGNVLNFIAWARSRFDVTPDDVFTNVNPLYFDNSVFDVYGSLFNGASLVPVDAATLKDPYQVLARIDALDCTIYFSVPSLLVYFQTLKLMTPDVFRSVRKVIFGGEGYPKAKLKELYDALHPRVGLVNVYGPTECTCICSAYDISEADFSAMDGYAPLGSLIPNFSYEILDEADEPVPVGHSGELCLSGPCVGLGYFGEPELTRTAFRQNPRNTLYHEWTYRTGDLVRLSPEDGKIHFVGRRDSQIKHQGYRIELGEIEHALGRVQGIDEAAVVHSSRDGVSLIVAVVASRGGLPTGTIRQELARLVPSYMLPERIDVLDRLPKNANGKIDRSLLKARYG